MNAAVMAKMMARKGKPPSSVEIEASSIIHFLQNKNERNFITTFAKGLVTSNKNIEFYLALWRAIKTLDRKNHKIMQSILGMEIDLINILWVYRLKKFYGIWGDTTYSYLIPLRHRLATESLVQIVHCKNIGALQEVLNSTVYSGVFGDFADPEERLRQAVEKKYKTSGKTSHIALVCGYLYGLYRQ